MWNPLLRQPQPQPAPFWHLRALLPFTFVFIYYFLSLLAPPTRNRTPHAIASRDLLSLHSPCPSPLPMPGNSRRWCWAPHGGLNPRASPLIAEWVGTEGKKTSWALRSRHDCWGSRAQGFTLPGCFEGPPGAGQRPQEKDLLLL